jgi:hypothetical protein
VSLPAGVAARDPARLCASSRRLGHLRYPE